MDGSKGRRKIEKNALLSYICINVYTYTHAYICMHVHIYVYMHTYVYMHVFVYIYTHIHKLHKEYKTN